MVKGAIDYSAGAMVTTPAATEMRPSIRVSDSSLDESPALPTMLVTVAAAGTQRLT